MRYYNLSIRGRTGDFTLACSPHVYRFEHSTTKLMLSIVVSINLSLLFVIQTVSIAVINRRIYSLLNHHLLRVEKKRRRQKDIYFRLNFVLKIYNK